MAEILLDSEQDLKPVNYGSLKHYNNKLKTQNDAEYLAKDKIGDGLSLDENGVLSVNVTGVTADTALSDTSENPVQNKVIKAAINEKATLGETSTTAYYGDKGKIAYEHSQTVHAPVNAEPNQNAFGNVIASGTTVFADNATDTLTLDAGNNITITPDSAVNKITISSNAINDNLLINPDFKINQRGQAYYRDDTANIYSVDRWQVCSGWNESIDAYGNLLVTCVMPGINTWIIRQRIEKYQGLAGKTVTLSASVITASDKFSLVIYDGKTQTTVTISTRINSVTHTVASDATELSVGICSDSTESMYEQYFIYWAKLECGTLATSFIPPDPTVEMTKCRRFYRTLSRGCNAYCSGAGSIIFTEEFDIPMRTIPTINILSSVLLNHGNGWIDMPDKSALSVLSANISEYGVAYIHVSGFNMTAFYPNYSLRAATDNFIELDAEIY